jgi:hypothetical protein
MLFWLKLEADDLLREEAEQITLTFKGIEVHRRCLEEQ